MPSSIPKTGSRELNAAGERLDLLADFAGGGDALVQAAFEAAADGLAIIDLRTPDLRVVQANRRLADALAVDAAVLRGQSLLEWTDELGAATLRELAERVGRAPRSRVAEVLLSPGRPQQRWMRVTGTALESTRAPLLLATFTDISDRRAIDVVTATLPVELIGLDRDLIIRWANPAAAAAARTRRMRSPSADLVMSGWPSSRAISCCPATRAGSVCSSRGGSASRRSAV